MAENRAIKISSMETVLIWQAIDLLIAITTDNVKLRELNELREKLRGGKQ